MISLNTEGDVNSGLSRVEWIGSLDAETRFLLDEDAGFFIHQDLSTPCLDVVDSCEGAYLVTHSGKRILDFHGNNLHQVGYKNPFVLEAFINQLNKLPFSPRRFTNQTTIKLAEKLINIAPSPLSRVLFAPGGAEANSMAVRLARIITGRFKILSMWGSFHGAGLDTISVGGEAQFSKGSGPALPGIIHVPPPDMYRSLWKDDPYLDQYVNYIRFVIENEQEIGALIAEPIRNTTVQVPHMQFWQKIRKICDEYGILLIFDEIPTALGRTGRFFVFEHFDVVPDIVTIGKGLAGGMVPMAAVIVKEQFNTVSEHSIGHFTFEKNPAGSAAAIAVIDFITENNLLSHVIEMEAIIREKSNVLFSQFEKIGQVRGIGLLWAIELVTNRETKEKACTLAEKIMYGCLKSGLNFKVSQGNIITLAPPLIINKSELEAAFEILTCEFEKYLK